MDILRDKKGRFIKGAPSIRKGILLSEQTRQKMSASGKKKIFTETHRSNISLALQGRVGGMFGKKHTKKTIQKMRKSHKGLRWTKETREKMSGENSPVYIKDRSKLKRYNDVSKDRRSYAYANWRKSVWERDNFKCKIADNNCKGNIEAHHILGWVNYPELRYEVNNGITLCQAHHPRKRSEEVKLSPYFQQLIALK